MPLSDETKKRALKILERRDYSVGELTAKLTDKGETPESAALCADWLVSLRLLDDGKYAAMLVRHYSGKGYGRARVRQELSRHKLPRELWDEALEGLPEPDDTLDRLLRQKLRGAAPEGVQLKKAVDSLLRRGFRWQEVSEAVERLRSEAGEV